MSAVRIGFKIYSPTPFDAAKALKLEEDFSGGCMSMYSTPDKMKMSTPGCFPGRYSPTSYRGGPDQMRRCMTNPSVSRRDDENVFVLATILKLYSMCMYNFVIMNERRSELCFRVGLRFKRYRKNVFRWGISFAIHHRSGFRRNSD